MDAIKIVSLTKKYKDVTAVDNLSMTVEQGELFSLLGVNGAGKTTTIKMLACLTEPTSGDAFLNGKSIIKDTADVKSIIAVSPQETAVAPGLSVKEKQKGLFYARGKKRMQRAYTSMQKIRKSVP